MPSSQSHRNLSRRDVLQGAGVGAATLGTPVLGTAQGASGNGVGPTRIPADSEAGFNFPYYLYAPNTLTSETRPILVNPNHATGPGESFEEDVERDRERVADTMRAGRPRHIADDLGVPLLIPVFSVPLPEEELPLDVELSSEEQRRHDRQTFYLHALDAGTMHIGDGRWERIDLQLLRMVEHATQLLAEESYPVADADELLLNGFSSAGDFVNRFTVLHPDRVLSVTAGGVNGMTILPVSEAAGHTLNYPIGVANIESVTGEAFDLASYSSVPQYIYIGSDDDNDTLPGMTLWNEELPELLLDVFGEDIHDDRFPYSRSVHEAVGTAAVFEMYDGVGHTYTDEIQRDIVDFHEQQLGGEPDDISLLDVVEAVTGRELTPAVAGITAGFGLAAGAAGYVLNRRSSDEE